MDIHNIVLELYNDRRVNEFIRKQQPADLQDDLLHHCITEIYRVHEKYPGKIEKLHELKQLWPWFHGMACMQLKSKTSTFYRKFRRQFESEDHIPRNLCTMPDVYKEPPNEIDQNLLEYAYQHFEREKPKTEPALEQLKLFIS